jgi:hypothetical protein
MASLLGVALALTSACGGEEPPPPAPAEAPTAGGEAVAAAPAEPVGPPQSYVTDGDTVVMRVDMARVRDSALSADIASLVRSYPTWRELLGSSGIDPVRDFDRVLVAAPSAVTGRGTMLIRHHLSDADIREAVLSMSVDRGTQPAWREVGGFDVVDWPAETDPPRVVVLTGPGELVVTTPNDLDRVVAVAADHRTRRAGEELVEPALQLGDGTIATVVAEQLTEYARRRMRHPPEAFEVVLRDDGEEGRLRLRAQGTYADAETAEAARSYYLEQRDFYAEQMLVRAVGLDRPLREATIEADGARVDVSASFTEEEIQRVLGLVALGQLGGS